MPKAIYAMLGASIIIPFLGNGAEALSSITRTQALTRTYVSGTGSDSNPCTVTAPCKTFKAALNLTVAGGEIYVLNSADYGPVVINKSVTITSEGAVAGVLVTSGQIGIKVAAGASDVVNLRGLEVDGANSGGVGIQFTSGQALNISKSDIRGFVNTGIQFAPTGPSSLYVGDTTLANNKSNGILLSSGGSGPVNVALNRVTASSNGVGIFANGGAVNLTLTDTVMSNNNYGVGASSSRVMVRNSTISSNGVGIAADQSSIVRVGQTTITANGTGWQATNAGQVLSYSNNNVSGNGIDGNLTSTLALQ